MVEDLNEAHDGYIEVYLNLGWIGLFLIVAILIGGYRRSVKAFQCDPELGGLFLAYVVVAVFYNVTEAGFRMLSPSWIFLLLAIVSASALTAVGIRGGKSAILSSRTVTDNTATVFDNVIAERKTVSPGLSSSL